MKTIPEVSAVIPCYGAEDFLPRIISCLEKQTFRNFEIILVNDGGSVRQRQVMQELQQENEKIRIVDQKNGGVSSARNAGIDAARGNYIVFADPDDEVKPYYLQSLYDAAQNNKADIAIGGISECFVETEKVINHFIEADTTSGFKQEVIEKVDEVLLHVSVSKIYKTSFLRDNQFYFPVGITIAEDVRFWLEICIKTNPVFSLVKDCGYVYYRYGKGNANSRYQSGLAQQNSQLVGCLNSFVEQMNWDAESKEHYLTNYLYKMGHRLCINYFEKGTPLSFFRKKKLIKTELLQNKELMHAYYTYTPQGNSIQMKLYHISMKTKNAFVIALCFSLFYSLKSVLKR